MVIMKMYLKNNVIYKPIKKGYTFRLRFRGPAGYLAGFNSIRVDFKSKKSLTAPAVISCSLGDGIEVEGDDMIITIDKTFTPHLRQGVLYADGKAESVNADPVKLFDGVFEVVDKATP